MGSAQENDSNWKAQLQKHKFPIQLVGGLFLLHGKYVIPLERLSPETAVWRGDTFRFLFNFGVIPGETNPCPDVRAGCFANIVLVEDTGGKLDAKRLWPLDSLPFVMQKKGFLSIPGYIPKPMQRDGQVEKGMLLIGIRKGQTPVYVITMNLIINP